MNSYQNHELDLRNVLIANQIGRALNRPPPSGPESNHFYQANDFSVRRSERSSNEAPNRVQPASSNPLYSPVFPFGSSQNLNSIRPSDQHFSTSSFKPPNLTNPFNFGSSQSTSTANDPFNFGPASISPRLVPAPSTTYTSQQSFLGHNSHTYPISPLGQSSIFQSSVAPQSAAPQSAAPQSAAPQSAAPQSIVQPSALRSSPRMTTSTPSTNTKSTHAKLQSKKVSRFQELPLFFTEVEIVQAFQNYVTNRGNFMVTLKKSHCDGIKFNQKSIFVRFCKFDPSRGLQKENLPKSVRLTINSCIVPIELKNTSPHLKSPVDVTARCKIVQTRAANIFDFYLDSSMDECKKLLRGNGYGIEVVLARKLAVRDTLQALRISDTHTRSYDQTLKLIKERCAGFDEIQCEALKVPLTCVVTKKIIQLPLVGLKCRHVNCFDGATFLEMHENKQELVCVICHNLIRRNELVRDPWIERILQDTKRTVEQIEFDSFGKYKISQPEKCAPRQRLKRIECITLDDDEEEAMGRTESPVSLKLTVRNPLKRPKLEMLDALNLASTSGTSQQALPSSLLASNSSPNQNGSLFAHLTSTTPNPFFVSTFSQTASANGAPPTSTAPAASVSMENAIDLTDTDSVIVLDSDSDVSHYGFESNHNSEDTDDALNLRTTRRRYEVFSDDSNEDTEISEEENEDENTIENDSNDSSNAGSDLNENGSLLADLEDESEDEDFLASSSRRRTRYEAFGSSDEEHSSTDLGDGNDSDEDSLSDLSSNSNLSSLSSSSSSSSGSKSRQAAQSGSSTFTPLLSRGSLNKRRRSQRFD